MVNNNGLFAFDGNTNSSNDSKENNNMNTVNPTITAQQIFDGARVWEASSWEKRLDFTKEQIATMTPDAFFRGLFADGTTRITQHSDASKAAGKAVIYGNGPQMRQFGAALAIAENIPYISKVVQQESGLRVFALLDTAGNHDIQVVEEAHAITGEIVSRVHYASKRHNHLNQIIGLDAGSVNKVHLGIEASVNGYNQWVDAHNAAIMRASLGQSLAEDAKFLETAKKGDNPNHFVQLNSVKHVNYSSVVDKYTLTAWILNARKTGVSMFEVHSFAKTGDTMGAFLDGRSSKMVYGYQRQLETLSGFKYVAPEA
jgi:hypothetical protein